MTERSVMEIKNLEPILKEHPFFRDLKPADLSFIAGCASNVVFKAGDMINREGDPADTFYLIRQGRVAIDIQATENRNITIQTVQEGEILGWSWLIPPHRNKFNSRAVTDIHAIALNGKCLREKCETNHDLGYELIKRLAVVFTKRLEMTRIQLLDLYEIKVKD